MAMSENNGNQGYTQEVRIASVMFGGVSLAVYKNGITQELLKAVRATAPLPAPRADKEWTAGDWVHRRKAGQLLDDNQLTSTESVYRILGRSPFHGRAVGTPLPFSGSIRTRVVGIAASLPAQILQEASTVPANDAAGLSRRVEGERDRHDPDEGLTKSPRPRLRDSAHGPRKARQLVVTVCLVERLQQIAFDLLQARAVRAVRRAT